MRTRERIMTATTMALALGLGGTPATARDEPSFADKELETQLLNERSRAIVEANVLPLPATLNCAESYVQREVSQSWYPTTSAYEHTGLDDDDIDPFELPFPFIYYGVRYKTINIGSNGWVSFTETVDDAPASVPMPSPAVPNTMIAAYWADLDPSVSGTLYLETVGNEPNRAYVMTYDSIQRYNVPGDVYTFQIVLYETSNIVRIQWLSQVGNNFDMAIGIEDETGTVGHEFTRLTPIDLNGRAIEYVPTMPALPSCASPRPLACGDSLTVQTMGTVSNARQYGCSLLNYDGFEVQYSFTVDKVTLIDLQATERGANNLNLFLMPACDRCNCIAGASLRSQRVIGPGTYSVVVDTRGGGDSGTFDLSLSCEPLLGTPTGYDMQVGAPACDLNLDFDAYANGRGVWIRDNWFRFASERNYVALRVDGSDNRMYATNIDQSSCAPFSWMSAWVDDVSDKAIVFWEAPEGIVVQTIQGHENAAGCCGVFSSFRVINTDTQGRWFELRELRSFDFGPGQSSCQTSGRMEGGYLELGATTYTTEQNLTCEPGGLCGTACATAARVLSLETLEPQISVQTLGNSAANAIDAEWVRFYDVNRICDPATPEPWVGGYLPTPDPTDLCLEDDALLYSWTMRPGGVDIPVGGSATVAQTFGKGCEMATECPCFAIADLQTCTYTACTNNPIVLEGIGSQVPGCTDNGGTITYDWVREGTSTGVTTASYPVNEANPGTYTYGVTVGCSAAAYPCVDTTSIQVDVIDCALCNITSMIDAPWTEACQGVPVVIDTTTSIINGCPTTPTYSWTRDGVPISETTPSILADVSTPGNFTYTATITCPLPGGVNCSDTSMSLSINVNDCSSCAATPDLAGDTNSVCLGTAAVLDAGASVVTGCPVAPTYTWRKDGNPLPDTTTSINAVEAVAGSFVYDVTVGCTPAGGTCSGTSQPWNLAAFDCATCDVTTNLVGDANSACAGIPVMLDSNVVVSNCPGTTTLAWQRNGVPLPDTTDAISVTETVPGSYIFAFSGRCDPPPTGLSCSDTATPWALAVVDCSNCAITADLLGDTSSVCIGTPINLSAAGSNVVGCPGAVVYRWRRNGLPIAPSTAVIPVTEAVPGGYLYDVEVACGPPPVGANCMDAANSWPLNAVDCAGCSLTADLSNSPPDVCVNTMINLTTSASTITNCPGTATYAWTRDGVPVAGTGPTLPVNEPNPGAFDYGVTISCDPPPTGLICPSSQTNWLLSTSACQCSITAGIAAPQDVCTNDTVILDALAGSTIVACPGTLQFDWTENGVPVVGATMSTLSVMSAVATSNDYTVMVSCVGVPGLSCEDTSATFTVTWTDGAPPGDLENTLLAYRDALDVEMVWQQDPAGASQTYDVLRGASKLDLPLPGPPVHQMGLGATATTDAAIVLDGNPYYYRVRGVSCPGLVGPY